MNLGGSMTRQSEIDGATTDPSMHIVNIGKAVEAMENRIRSEINISWELGHCSESTQVDFFFQPGGLLVFDKLP